MPLVVRQQHELWLTAAQSLFALVLIADGSMLHWEAVVLLVLFVAQLALPPAIGPVDVRLTFTAAYLGLSLVLLLLHPQRRRAIVACPRAISDMLRRPAETAAGLPGGEAGRGSTPPRAIHR
jgi:hypothetical protein